MKMLVAAVGTVVPPIRVDERRQSASFTLKVDDDRFFVATVGLGQYERMSVTQGSANLQLLVLGYAYSYRSHKCGQHHVVITARELALVTHDLEMDEQEAGLLLRPIIKRLRRKLREPLGEVDCIKNVWGRGYMLISGD